jgi:molecular chaperone IbpA
VACANPAVTGAFEAIVGFSLETKEKKMTRFDLTPLYRSTIGFDRLANILDGHATKSTSFPPYNVQRIGEHDYRISMAVAGFSERDIELEQRGGILTVNGNLGEKTENGDYLYRGIANRDFERQFQLADNVKVKGAELNNGLLHIDLVREIPEAEKPRKIDIVKTLNAA